jgi:hypothetical protein
MADTVLGPHGFCCSSAPACRGSVPAGDDFYEGQLSYVGRRYEVAAGDRPCRVLIIGMDTGRPDRCVTQVERRKQVEVRMDEPLSRRNPHMRGTTLALRVLFDVDEDLVEIDGEEVHVLQAYAMANARLCSAIRGSTTQSRGTNTMTRNCLRHVSTTVNVLEPQVVVLQGTRIRAALAPIITAPQRLSGTLERIRIGHATMLLASLGHPSYPGPKGNWSWPSSPYFLSVVQPTLTEARNIILTPDHAH